MPIPLSPTGLSPSLAGLPKTVLLTVQNHLCSPNPGMHALWFGLFRFRSPLLPGIDVSFFSSGYLDVSVRRVPFHTLWIGYLCTDDEVFSCGFPHSDILRINGYLLLPAAFRSLSRLSSALSAKASTLCSFCLTSSSLLLISGFTVYQSSSCMPFSSLVLQCFFFLSSINFKHVPYLK